MNEPEFLTTEDFLAIHALTMAAARGEASREQIAATFRGSAGGRVQLALKTPLLDGTIVLTLTPEPLVARLAVPTLLRRPQFGTVAPIAARAGMTMPTTLGLKVDDVLRDRLARVADALDRSPHWVMKTALESFLTAEEQRLAEAAHDEARWGHYALTGESVSHASAKAWLEALARGETSPWPS